MLFFRYSPSGEGDHKSLVVHDTPIFQQGRVAKNPGQVAGGGLGHMMLVKKLPEVVVRDDLWLVGVGDQVNLVRFREGNKVLGNRAAVINVDLVNGRLDLQARNRQAQ